jgi:hypothetical protein
MKEFNGKKYREIESIEEAEQFLGKRINFDTNSSRGFMIVNHIYTRDDNQVYIGDLDSNLLLNCATLQSGQPVGIEVKETFKLPELTILEDSAADICGISHKTLQIRKFISGIVDKPKPPIENLLFIGFNYYIDENKWDYCFTYKNYPFVLNFICGLTEAKEICKILNENKITLE